MRKVGLTALIYIFLPMVEKANDLIWYSTVYRFTIAHNNCMSVIPCVNCRHFLLADILYSYHISFIHATRITSIESLKWENHWQKWVWLGKKLALPTPDWDNPRVRLKPIPESLSVSKFKILKSNPVRLLDGWVKNNACNWRYIKI